MHVADHCDLPYPNRHWRRLGVGATYTCTCNKQYRLESRPTPDGFYLSWVAV